MCLFSFLRKHISSEFFPFFSFLSFIPSTSILHFPQIFFLHSFLFIHFHAYDTIYEFSTGEHLFVYFFVLSENARKAKKCEENEGRMKNPSENEERSQAT